MKHKTLNGRDVFGQDGRLLKRLIVVFIIAVALSAAVFGAYHFVKSKLHSESSFFTLRTKWRDSDYQGVYSVSNAILYERPFNHTALMFHGYAAFFLSAAETDTVRAFELIDEAIINIRQSLLSAKSTNKDIPQLEYMLGKAYFYKDTLSSYGYYADLAVRYLLSAANRGYKADDISELLGLSYAALGMTMESISSFTEALLVRESDILLLSIAEQYFNAGQYPASEQYIRRISEECKDEKIVQKGKLLLGEIYLAEEQLAEAEAVFQSMVDELGNIDEAADAYYGLGRVHEKRGDLIKARNALRKAYAIRKNHPGVLAALSRIAEKR